MREQVHRNIARLFTEGNSSHCSIHHLMSIASSTLGKKPGDWFGPSSTAHLLKEAVKNASQNTILNDITIYVN